MRECQNCGIPMIKKEDFGNGDLKNNLCRHCARDKNFKTVKNTEKQSSNNSDACNIKKDLFGVQDIEKDDFLKV